MSKQKQKNGEKIFVEYLEKRYLKTMNEMVIKLIMMLILTSN